MKIVKLETVISRFLKNIETILLAPEEYGETAEFEDLKEDIGFDANYIASQRPEFIGSTPLKMYQVLKTERGC